MGKFFINLNFMELKKKQRNCGVKVNAICKHITFFWDTTGHETNGKSYCYPCDSVTVLAEENTRQQSKRGFDGNIWGTVTNDKVELLYKEKWKKVFGPQGKTLFCMFIYEKQ